MANILMGLLKGFSDAGNESIKRAAEFNNDLEKAGRAQAMALYAEKQKTFDKINTLPGGAPLAMYLIDYAGGRWGDMDSVQQNKVVEYASKNRDAILKNFEPGSAPTYDNFRQELKRPKVVDWMRDKIGITPRYAYARHNDSARIKNVLPPLDIPQSQGEDKPLAYKNYHEMGKALQRLMSGSQTPIDETRDRMIVNNAFSEYLKAGTTTFQTVDENGNPISGRITLPTFPGVGNIPGTPNTGQPLIEIKKRVFYKPANETDLMNARLDIDNWNAFQEASNKKDGPETNTFYNFDSDLSGETQARLLYKVALMKKHLVMTGKATEFDAGSQAVRLVNKQARRDPTWIFNDDVVFEEIPISEASPGLLINVFSEVNKQQTFSTPVPQDVISPPEMNVGGGLPTTTKYWRKVGPGNFKELGDQEGEKLYKAGIPGVVTKEQMETELTRGQ